MAITSAHTHPATYFSCYRPDSLYPTRRNKRSEMAMDYFNFAFKFNWSHFIFSHWEKKRLEVNVHVI